MKDEKGILLLRLKNHKEGVSIIKKGARWQDSPALVALYQARQADLPEGASWCYHPRTRLDWPRAGQKSLQALLLNPVCCWAVL